MRDALDIWGCVSQAEETYISAEDFCKMLQQEPSVVLQNEVTMLQVV